MIMTLLVEFILLCPFPRESLPGIVRVFSAKACLSYLQILVIVSIQVTSHLCSTGCDASLLCAKQPALFYGSSEADLHAAAKQHQELCRALPGLDVDEMVQEDPLLLFSDLQWALKQFSELWDVDAEVLQNSETAEVALAIRALSKSGPPKKY
jgi:hypothetical protein